MFLLLVLQLERAADGFSVVAEYYGRGVFNKVGVNCITLQFGISCSSDIFLTTL